MKREVIVTISTISISKEKNRENYLERKLVSCGYIFQFYFSHFYFVLCTFFFFFSCVYFSILFFNFSLFSSMYALVTVGFLSLKPERNPLIKEKVFEKFYFLTGKKIRTWQITLLLQLQTIIIINLPSLRKNHGETLVSYQQPLSILEPVSSTVLPSDGSLSSSSSTNTSAIALATHRPAPATI